MNSRSSNRAARIRTAAPRAHPRGGTSPTAPTRSPDPFPPGAHRSGDSLGKFDVATMPPEDVEVDVGNGVTLIKSKVRARYERA